MPFLYTRRRNFQREGETSTYSNEEDEPGNPVHPDAVAVKINGNLRGYVARSDYRGLRQWQDENGATNWAQLRFLHVRTEFSTNVSYDSHRSYPQSAVSGRSQKPGGGLFAASASNRASTSISTNSPSPTIPATTSVFAGAIPPKARPCARATTFTSDSFST